MKGVEFWKGSKVMLAQDVGVHVFQFFIEIAISWGHEMSAKGTIQFSNIKRVSLEPMPTVQSRTHSF